MRAAIGKTYARAVTAIEVADAMATANGTPVIILERDGWYAISEEPPDDLDPSPYDVGWTDYALVDPTLSQE